MNNQFNLTIGRDATGTYLNGYLDAGYKDIKKAFGNPSDADGYKVDAQWTITVNGKVITIYNYKDGVNYNGKKHGTPKTKIRDWHIGGNGNTMQESLFIAQLVKGTYRNSY